MIYDSRVVPDYKIAYITYDCRLVHYDCKLVSDL